MKKRYLYLISFIFLMFLVLLFIVSADGNNKWIECKSPCPQTQSKCAGVSEATCCKSTEKLPVSGIWYCCLESNIWGTLPSNDVCDGLDNDCNAATKDGSGETAPNCINQVGVCSGSKKSCGGASGWLACTSTDYTNNNANYESAETKCDGLDNNCNGKIDEGCDDDKDSYADSIMACSATINFRDGNGVSRSCSTYSGDCVDDNININPGVNENDNTLCGDNVDNDCDGNKDCADPGCKTYTGPGGVRCCQSEPDCNRGNANDKCITETCRADKTCSYKDKDQCDSTECTVAGTYCDKGGSSGGTCKTPDESSDVCLNCAADQTSKGWTSTNHRDDGIGYNVNLFNSDGLDCPTGATPGTGSCSDTTSGACKCYGTSGVPGSAKHKLPMGSGSCCGDDANEYFKSNYYGPECTSDVNDCVWSDGNAQASNTGNKEYWCYQHEWSECRVNNDIGKKFGSVTCAGTSSNKKWTASPSPESSYSCADGFDNDGDTKIDCADTDCNSQVCSTQTITCTLDQNLVCKAGDIYADTGEDKTCDNLCVSSVCGTCVPSCDKYLKADCADACSGETSASNFAADSPVADNDLCTAGQTSCPSTATFADTCGVGDVLTEYFCSGNEEASSIYDCDNSDNINLDGACGAGTDSCKTRDYSCLDSSNMDYCSSVAVDLDTSSSSCAAGGAATSWISTGEAVAHGEYSAGQNAAACCGDDSNEKIITAGVGDTKCCNLATKCIDSGGVCRENAAENTVSNGCSDGIDNDCDGNSDCADSDCKALQGPGGVRCCQAATDCAQNNCVEETCEMTNPAKKNTCAYADRGACDPTECTVAGTYCDKGGSLGGTCKTPDESPDVCGCAAVTDQTPAVWMWTPTMNHQDAGKAYSGNDVCLNPPSCTDTTTDSLYNSGGNCLAASCSDNDEVKCACYNELDNPVGHKAPLDASLRNCCGDDANEYFKSNYYGPECTSDVNDCVWSDGNAQASNTGNKEYWCYQHEWSECRVNNDIGKKVGGVTCAGTSTTKKWTPNGAVLKENEYTPAPCSDGLDNDGDGKTDCEDIDCGTTVSGYVKNTNNAALYQARVDVLQNAALKYSVLTDASGSYKIDRLADSVYCGTYDMIASATDYISSAEPQVNFAPDSAITQDFTLALGTSCEADCTYAGDNTMHQECEGANGCKFCPDGCASPTCTPSIAQQSCNLAQPGWDRLYNDPSQPECSNGCLIVCQERCPEAKIDTKATVTCGEGKSLIKATKLVMYKGKLLKLNVAVCG